MPNTNGITMSSMIAISSSRMAIIPFMVLPGLVAAGQSPRRASSSRNAKG